MLTYIITETCCICDIITETCCICDITTETCCICDIMALFFKNLAYKRSFFLKINVT